MENLTMSEIVKIVVLKLRKEEFTFGQFIREFGKFGFWLTKERLDEINNS